MATDLKVVAMILSTRKKRQDTSLPESPIASYTQWAPHLLLKPNMKLPCAASSFYCTQLCLYPPPQKKGGHSRALLPHSDFRFKWKLRKLRKVWCWSKEDPPQKKTPYFLGSKWRVNRCASVTGQIDQVEKRDESGSKSPVWPQPKSVSCWS